MHGITNTAAGRAAGDADLRARQRRDRRQSQLGLIGIGALIGLVIVAIDEILRRTAERQFPPLAVALGIYLPMAVTFMVVVGAFAGKALQRLGGGRREPRRRETAGHPARVGH